MGPGREALLLPSTGTEEKVGMPHLPASVPRSATEMKSRKPGLREQEPNLL